jgi:lipopolysaccharide export system permease protein
MEDESVMGNRDLGKNINELSAFIDSVRQVQDSISLKTVPSFKGNAYANAFKEMKNNPYRENDKIDSLFAGGFRAYFNRLNIENKIRYLQQAKGRVEQLQTDYTFSMYQQSDAQKQIRSHSVEWHKRFALALSCILFFFIGASLGAIIRKGGLGMPTVLSVFLYLFYYTTHTFGTKMAKQGVWDVWEGMWLSSLILAALGIFFTYKSVNDSTMLSPDAWKNFYQKLTGKKEIRNYSKKEVIMTPPDYTKDIREMEIRNIQIENYLREHKKIPFYLSFWKKGFADPELDNLIESMENTIEDLLNSDENLIIGKLMDYPVIRPFRLKAIDRPAVRWFCGIVFPIGLILYARMLHNRKQISGDLIICRKVNENIIDELRKNKQI